MLMNFVLLMNANVTKTSGGRVTASAAFVITGALYAFVSVGCRAAPEQSFVVVPIAQPALGIATFAGEEIDPALGELLNRLRVAFEIGDEMRCRAYLDSARKMDPPGVVEDYLNQVEALVVGRALVRAIERDAKVDPIRDQVTLGDPVPLTLRMSNVHYEGDARTLTIPRKVGGGLFSSGPVTETRLVATVTTTDLDAYGGESSFTNNIAVNLKNDIEIPEGGNFSMEFQIDGEAPRAAVARMVTVGAELLPADVQFGKRPVFITRIQFEPGTVICLPAGYESAAVDPVGALQELLNRREMVVDRSILPAAMLVTEDKRNAALRALAKKLSNAEQGRARAIIAALRYITKDRERGLDLHAWNAWAARFLSNDLR
ncbi:MAG: hypothetical protein ACKVS6_11310 [Planctomycetota bacterium]